MRNIIFALFLLSMSPNLQAYLENTSIDRFAGLDTMGGYKYSQFINFEKDWKLVTVRYRVDTGELRFTYANKLAWNTLINGKTDYPDGAIFGKVGYMTSEDPAFTSSKAPSGSRRFQFMIKNKIKHKQQDGWGYALFDSKGKTFAEDPQVKIEACAACHRIVPERGYVFSEPMNPSEAILTIRAKYKETNGLRFTFDQTDITKITGPMQPYLEGAQKVDLLSGPLRKSIFQGTLDEITPTLMEFSEKNNLPAALASEDFSRFTLVKFSKNRCAKGSGFDVIQTEVEKDEKGNYKIIKKVVCK